MPQLEQRSIDYLTFLNPHLYSGHKCGMCFFICAAGCVKHKHVTWNNIRWGSCMGPTCRLLHTGAKKEITYRCRNANVILYAHYRDTHSKLNRKYKKRSMTRVLYRNMRVNRTVTSTIIQDPVHKVSCAVRV